ncbi:MAG: NAD(P)H-dependent glycerol-3-phosphate dehydrogenase [Synergistes sp.]|nr:NAD(P)H-dependent glycerol-3-phosphate dehydrogenase [Synergistes sp.]
MNITILGAGSFGTAMASHLAKLGHSVMLWARDKVKADEINNEHTNTSCFKGKTLPCGICASEDLSCALAFSDLCLAAIPTQAQRCVLSNAAGITTRNIHILNLAKGIEISSGKLLHEIYAEVCPQFVYSALSGPSHAEELFEDMPTTVALASFGKDESEMWQRLLNGSNLRIYTASDVIGLEVGGAAKNIYAIAAGISRAMKLGDNALAALASRSLAEIMRLGVKMGASPLTLSGLAGVGDLVVTCYSTHSRNFRLGFALGEGKTLTQAIDALGQVAEGAYTVRAIVENAQKFNVEMPLAEAVYGVLYMNKDPKEMLKRLFARPVKPEMRL